jgi:hypothetical protein
VTPTVTLVGVNSYDVTWTEPHPNGTNYVFFANTRFNGVVNYVESSIRSTGLRVNTFNLTGGAVASDFTFMTYP